MIPTLFKKQRKNRISSPGIAGWNRSAIWARDSLLRTLTTSTDKFCRCRVLRSIISFFTHDVLLTDLGAVNFDLQRVKRDLFYIASLSKENVIPTRTTGATNGFKTEYCAPITGIISGSFSLRRVYYRHSLDSATLHALYPLMSKSVELILTQRKADG